MFRVVEPGLQTTVQDAGRKGRQKFGVPPGGAADMFSFRVANLLCGNDQLAPALEMTLIGPVLDVLGNATLALAGANLSAHLNGKPLAAWRSFEVRKGDVVSFGKTQGGCRLYLAVAGGLDEIPLVLGSRSTCLRGGFGGIDGRPLRKSDVLKCKRGGTPHVARAVPDELVARYTGNLLVNSMLGPQAEYFTEKGLAGFFTSEYKVLPESDRMGYRLEGPVVESRSHTNFISDPVPLGAVQITPSGMPIVMMADRPTTGGYPKIATVATADTYCLAQARPGDLVRFAPVSAGRAVDSLKRFERRIARIAALFTT